MPAKSDDETTPIDRSKDAETVRHLRVDAGDETIIRDRAGDAADPKVRRIGRYRLLSELGRGGQGAVYLAEDTRIGRKVALKVLFGGLAHSTEARLRFEREAEVTGRLNHPGIARIYEMDEADGVLFIAMELVEGEPLSTRLKEAAQASHETGDQSQVYLDFESEDASAAADATAAFSSRSRTLEHRKDFIGVARFIEAAARAIHVAHEAGLVHRDIKPGNIMVREDESPCILDFGLAHDENSVGVTLTGSRDRFGTPAYMAPEQVLGRTKDIDRRTDVWALGVTLYECCTMKRPFEAPTLEGLFDRIQREEPQAPRSLNPRIPRDLEAIILTAIDKDPARRFASADDLACDLGRFCSYEPVVARPTGRMIKTLRWVQRNRLVATSGSLVLLAFLIAAVTFYAKSQESERAREKATRAELVAVEAQTRTERSLAAEKIERLAKEEALSARTVALEKAKQERDVKQNALDNYDRLADLKRLEWAKEAADLLFPPDPALVPGLLAWQSDHGKLAGNLEGHRQALDELRRHALPYTDEERKRDFAVELKSLEGAQVVFDDYDKRLAEARDDEVARAEIIKEREKFSESVAKLKARTTTGRKNWTFADEEVQFQHDLLADLTKELESFATDGTGPVQSVARRLAQSQAIERETLGEDMALRWSACRERIKASQLYPGLDLKPQLGLIPLGPDPRSGLEEFLHWLTHEGELPTRDASGTFAVTNELGVILVLVPGGSFFMGSQKDEASQPNFDSDSQLDEQPVNEIRLDPYLLAKYEMTQSQWLRAFGSNPSGYKIGAFARHSIIKAPITGCHPVESLSWNEAQRLLPRINLALPTEAEWERAARAGRRDQAYVACSDIGEIGHFDNIRGQETSALGYKDWQSGHQDDFILHAPVGSFMANGFGFHDMGGNVAEICLDDPVRYSSAPGPRGHRRDTTGSVHHIIRGGHYNWPANAARVARRAGVARDGRALGVGVRPVRLIP